MRRRAQPRRQSGRPQTVPLVALPLGADGSDVVAQRMIDLTVESDDDVEKYRTGRLHLIFVSFENLTAGRVVGAGVLS